MQRWSAVLALAILTGALAACDITGPDKPPVALTARPAAAEVGVVPPMRAGETPGDIVKPGGVWVGTHYGEERSLHLGSLAEVHALYDRIIAGGREASIDRTHRRAYLKSDGYATLTITPCTGAMLRLSSDAIGFLLLRIEYDLPPGQLRPKCDAGMEG